MAVAWPSSVPSRLLPGAASIQGPVTRREFQTDAGPPIVRTFSTVQNELVAFQFAAWTGQQFEAFRTWFYGDLSNAGHRFILPDPVTEVSTIWQMHERYQAQKATVKTYVNVSLQAYRVRLA